MWVVAANAGDTLALARSWMMQRSSAPPLPAPPWSIEELEACFVVKDSAGQTAKAPSSLRLPNF
jgi:hypothetical protein